ncbi:MULTISPECIES: hypothetical protein [Paenibacillus]|nr:hypothetical protein [Paenibacillus odorifer]
MAKGAFNPDEAWSADHWLNSQGMVMLLYGPVEKSLLPTGGAVLKPPKGLDSVKGFEVQKPLPAFSTNEGFQFKINNLDIDTPALPQTPMQINFKNEMDRILRVKMEGKSDSNHSIKDMELKAVEGTSEGKRASGKDEYGPYYDEAKKLHESNPDWYPNTDESIVVKGEELKQARADYEALVRRGELEKGHHVQGLSFGGENVDSNIKITGESTIRREKLEDLDLDFYHEMGYGKENAKVLKIFQNKNGIILFGNNPTHTEVTVFQNKILKWLRDNGKR